MTTRTISATARARAGWNDNAPDWVMELAAVCDASSQNRVAKRLGYSASVVSQVLSRTYKGDYARVEQKVRGELMRETLDCPVMGEIRKSTCVDNQRLASRGVIATSSMRSRLYHACRTCQHSRMGE